MRPETAQCHAALARLGYRVGERSVAGEHLTVAVELFREIGAAFWAERAEAEINEMR